MTVCYQLPRLPAGSLNGLLGRYAHHPITPAPPAIQQPAGDVRDEGPPLTTCEVRASASHEPLLVVAQDLGSPCPSNINFVPLPSLSWHSLSFGLIINFTTTTLQILTICPSTYGVETNTRRTFTPSFNLQNQTSTKPAHLVLATSTSLTH